MIEVNDTTKVRLSSNWRETLSKVCAHHKRVLLLASAGGQDRGYLAAAQRALAGVESEVLPHAPINPSIESLVDLFGKEDFQPFSAVVAIGGGSVIDAAKAIVVARGSSSQSDFEKRLRSGSAEPVGGDLQIVAIPTTAGTGSEVTPFATIWDTDNARKISISGNSLRPTSAILDSSLLRSLRGSKLLYPALDAVSHAIESLWSKRANSATRLNSATSLAFLSSSIATCMTETPHFEQLALGSLYGGLAISESRTAIAHSISYPLTLQFGVPHGLACSFTLNAIHELIFDRLGPYCEEIVWIEKTLNELKQFNLGERMCSYASLSDALSLADQMMTPGRGDNCLVTFEKDDVAAVVSRGYR